MRPKRIPLAGVVGTDVVTGVVLGKTNPSMQTLIELTNCSILFITI